jgi:tellurite resistance protein TerC
VSQPGPQPSRHRLIAGLQERRARHRERHVIVRTAVVVAGFTVLGAGALMLVLPGPALAVIPIGLAMLALEFAWAERLLERALEHAQRARDTAAAASRAVRVMTVVAGALAFAAVGAWGLVGDVPLLPI